MTAYLYPDSKILLFAKAPIAGFVKTRMQALLTPEQCVELHLLLLEHQLLQLEAATIAPVQLAVAGLHDYWDQIAARFHLQLVEQVEGDLGRRMSVAAANALNHCQSAVLIGSDCPFIDGDYLRSAFKAMHGGGVVFGPAHDGGYVLLGLNRLIEPLFNNINWGSCKVLQQSCQRLEQVAEPYHLLATKADIDRPEDIRQLEPLPYFKRWLSSAL